MFQEKILQSKKLEELLHKVKESKNILIEGLWNAPKALIIALAQQTTHKHVLILTGGTLEETRLYDDFAIFTDRPIIDYPAWETLPSENIAPSPDIVGERYKVLRQITENPQPHIIISNLQACLQKLILPKHFDRLFLALKKGEYFPFDDLVKAITEMGYTRSSVAADKGEFAIRGGIVDIFPVSSPDPFRIEFFGDEIESLRIYDPIGQKSVRPVDSVEITPAQELELLEKSPELTTLIGYLGKDTLIVFDDMLALEDRYANLVGISGAFNRNFCSIEEFLKQIEHLQHFYLTQKPIEELAEVHVTEKMDKGYYSASSPLVPIAFEMFNRKLKAMRWQHCFDDLAGFLLPELPETHEVSGDELLQGINNLEKESHLYFLCATETEETVLQKRMLENKVSQPPDTHFSMGYLSSGFVMQDIKSIFFPYTQISRHYKIRRQKMRSTYHTTPSEFYDLSVGEAVVHLNNGIGKYLGIEQKPNHLGIQSEFFLIEYAESAKLFVPLNQAHLISKYVGSNEQAPKLNTLGSNRWKKTRESTEKAILGYASELLDIYAKRTVGGGFHYPQDSDDLVLFEEEFPYVETEDQLSAIAAIKQDMQSAKSMDRLVCGDVGYGKTEVAMRACFKAVVDGQKQVAILVPTTVLALQHYENFVERMANFPVRVGVLSRFIGAKQTRETIEGVKNGSIDVLIGTHRIISDDIKFKNLGLIVIDEEQRFGVKAKEHLKKVKTGVDCLTLSATPIPRTLYMSMVGARDMSVINTPPQDRLPIKTIITDANDELIKNALLRELNRDGQVYYIHNRVETIFDVASHLKKLLPHARIVVGHGQMGADELDHVFHTFKSGKADILVATTIVENGIDIPNANTIIIDRADHFGLADLYQLRGRVGRWNRKAYAYFIVRRFHSLPEISRKRLTALAEASGYGGGMKVAMRDLEIRGAGDMLGTEQSGHVSSIGFHLYCKLLKRAIKALQGEVPAYITDVKVEFPFDARIPEEYINETSLRLEIYQRLGEALSNDEVDAIWEEMNDRFGPPPLQVAWLDKLTKIRIFGSLNGFTLLKFEKLSLTAEQQKQNQVKSRKILLPLPKKPDDYDVTVVTVLKKEFGI